MKRKTPPWPALEAFVAAARCNNFREAAEEIGLSASAFTRRIQALEHHLGLRLFDRDAAQATLTPAGQRYFDLLRPGFESLDMATAAMAPDAGARPLRLRISRSLAAVWLVPRLPRFHARNPDIALDLQSNGTADELETGAVDMGIFFRREPPTGLAARRLFSLEAFVVAAPALMPAALPALADLAHYPLLDLTDPGEVWPEWLRTAGYADAPPRAKYHFDSIDVMYRAAAAGLGLALGLRPVVDPFLADGRLRIVSTQRHAVQGAYYLAATRRTLQHAAARRLWNWVCEEGAAAMATSADRSREGQSA